jgi:hypothetical protein
LVKYESHPLHSNLLENATSEKICTDFDKDEKITNVSCKFNEKTHPSKFFSLFFTAYLSENLVIETNSYASQIIKRLRYEVKMK